MIFLNATRTSGRNMETNQNPVLSVVTINRNNASGLKITFDSMLKQNINEENLVEYIVIDGASTDESVDVIKEYEKLFAKTKISFSWISEPDKGIYNAMNKGLEKASGMLTGIMNSGDGYTENALNHALNLFKKNPDCIQYGVVNKYKDGHFEGALCPKFEYLEESMIPHNATFVPKKYYEEFGFYDESFKVLADFDRFLKFYTEKLPFLYSDNIVCDYDLSGISMTSDRVDMERELVLKRYGYYVPPTMKQKIKKILRKIFWFI